MKKMISVMLAVFGPAAFAGLLVTEVTGKAQIEGKGVVTTLAEIADGQRVSVSAGAHVVAVDLTDGREFVLKGGGNYLVAPGGPKAADGKTVETKPLPVKNLPYVRDARIATNSVALASLVMRGIREANIPLLLSPVRTVVMSKNPTFRWQAVDGATAYRLVLMMLDDTVVWDASTRQTEMPLPGARQLVPGENYKWRVEAVGERGTLSDALARFSAGQPDAIERLEQLRPGADAPFGRRVLYAVALREAGAVAEAKEMWRVLSLEHPEDGVIRVLADWP